MFFNQLCRLGIFTQSYIKIFSWNCFHAKQFSSWSADEYKKIRTLILFTNDLMTYWKDQGCCKWYIMVQVTAAISMASTSKVKLCFKFSTFKFLQSKLNRRTQLITYVCTLHILIKNQKGKGCVHERSAILTTTFVLTGSWNFLPGIIRSIHVSIFILFLIWLFTDAGERGFR